MRKIQVGTDGVSTPTGKTGRAPFLAPGVRVGPWRVEAALGSGWEGNVYRVRRGRRRQVLKCYRRRPGVQESVEEQVRHLGELRGCSSVPALEHRFQLVQRSAEWPSVVLTYLPGISLAQWHAQQSSSTRGVHTQRLVFLALLKALKRLHDRGSYHGDLHDENVLISRRGRGFQVSLIDPFPQEGPVQALQEQDLVDAVRLFGWLLGGAQAYATHPAWVRRILAGLQARHILARYASVTDLLAQLRQGSSGVEGSGPQRP